MRVVKEIPGDRYNTTIYSWNNKYLVKIEQGNYEQTFKVNEMDLLPGTDISEIVADEVFLKKVEDRFRDMDEDFGLLLQDHV
ncbi:MAG: hypothetical protein WBA74_23535 [Cyclobacteriaceae bacterium]